MSWRLIMRKLVVALPVLLLTGLGCTSPVGTWTVDIEKTLESIERMPEGYTDRYKSLESYKEWLAGEIKGLELTFTTKREVVHPTLFSKGYVKYVVTCTQGGSTRTIYWMDDKKYSLWGFAWMSGPFYWPQGEFVLGADTAVWQNMVLPHESGLRHLGVSGCFKRKSFWSRGLTFKHKAIIWTIAWILAHLGLFAAGFVCGRRPIVGKRVRWLSIALQLAAWVLAICAVICGIACTSWLFRDSLKLWLFVAASPLCCFFTGLAYGLTRKRTRLLPLALLALGIGIAMVALLMPFLKGFLI